MNPQLLDKLPVLYEEDETAWLDAMAQLIRENRLDELDYGHLQEYLSDMARRDRREVKSRLVLLTAHLLKWRHQPDKRTGSWRATIIEQRQVLDELLGGGVLRNHAEAILAEAYQNAVEVALAETALPAGLFPGECPFTLEELLSPDVLRD